MVVSPKSNPHFALKITNILATEQTFYDTFRFRMPPVASNLTLLCLSSFEVI